MWFASTPVALWHYVTVLRVTPGLFGDHLVRGSLKGATCAPLHVLVSFALLIVEGIFP